MTRPQPDHDTARPQADQASRQRLEPLWDSERMLRGVGRVAAPVGVAMDVYDLGQAHSADGSRIGENTGRAASGIAGGWLGGWGGAAAGLAFGAPFGPPGWIIGPIAGGLGGTLVGGTAGRKIFDAVRRWF